MRALLCLLVSACAAFAQDGFRPLFDGKSLTGWTVCNGKANYEIHDGVIVGTTVEGSPNSFLCTDRDYGDFTLELDIKNDVELNSGVQLRAHRYSADAKVFTFNGRQLVERKHEAGRVHGYQVEVATEKSQASGGIYDEARRGWVHNVSEDPNIRKAFKDNQWNHYKIEAIGDRIRSWVNGVPCADLIDSMDLTGFIALQVHAYKGDKPAQVRFRNIRIKEYGKHVWKPLTSWTKQGGGDWIMADGEMHGKTAANDQRTGFLLSDRTIRDATLRLKYKLARGNSGIFVRCDPQTHAGYEVEIDEAKGSGGLFEVGGRKWVTGPADNAAVRANDWNQLTASLHGDRIVFHLNGTKTVDLPNDTAGRKEGRIALQVQGSRRPTEVWFKDVEILEPEKYDVVLRGGRLMDPATNFDGVRNVGIYAGRVARITAEDLSGVITLDAAGQVVAPGFIDLHSHGQDDANYRMKAMDGVTSALELEIGTADVERWYEERHGKALIHHGVTIGHPPTRMKIFNDPGAFLPAGDGARKKATAEEITEMARRIERGLQRGAVGVGFGIAYTPGATAAELLDMFRVAARFKAPSFAHVDTGIEGLNAAIGYAASTGASLHVVHLNSSGGRRNTPQFLQIVEGARKNGLDVTTEAYPYTAGQTAINSALFDDGWQQRTGITYSDLLWPATGERLTAESFAKYRKAGGSVILFTNTEEMVARAIASPLTMIASDGILRNGVGHPRSAGTYARVLGRTVREQKVMSLMDAIRKMSLMPAQRLESRIPEMRTKGRVQEGADADIAVFDAARVVDRSTYEKPGIYSEGFRHVLVSGTPVVREGKLVTERLPGQAIRGTIAGE